MKYKNVVHKANRKKAEARKTGGGPPPPLTEAEKMALSQNSGRPIAEGISWGSSSDPPTPQDTGAYIKVTDGVICLVEPSAITDLHAEDGEDTLSAATEREDAERPVESHAGNYNEEEGPSTSTEHLTSVAGVCFPVQFIIQPDSEYGRGRAAGGWKRKNWVFGMLGVKKSDGKSQRPILRLVDRRTRQ
ncbi:uncharacterized protein LOC130384701 [Gadus chalcogrammus]|uniref:uncharacterized protein LOC130384701 n=1 Tax=Gadus chalcogrammus TaxID=1042646 RepID=UPI0024C24015|nr:uncharacterized protein LOC130384701 [Gadus chalcogrammus]